MLRVLIAVAVLAVAGTFATQASATTFTARITDPAGDAREATPDIVAARIAYNRRTGALSFSVTMADAIDVKATPAFVAIGFGGLKHGHCSDDWTVAAWMELLPPHDPPKASSGEFELIGASLFRGTNGQASAAARGKQVIDGDTISMRARSRKLGGLHPGCALVGIVTTLEGDNDGNDVTKGNAGFSTH